MERKPDGADRISKTRRIPHWTAKKLGKSYKVNRNSKKSYEKTIQTDLQRSSTRKDMDPLKSPKTLVKECFS